MKTTIDYPQSLVDLLQESPVELEKEMRFALGVKLYELKRIPSGMAAQLAGTTRVDFLLQLGRFGVAAIDVDETELSKDVANAEI